MKPPLVSDYPPPPEWLDSVGQDEWHRVVPDLKSTGVLARLDLSIIAMYCNQISIYVECEKLMRDQGTRVMVIKDETGKRVKYAQQVPYQKIANDALEKALKIASEFGMTASARTRIGVGLKSNQPSKILEMMAGGKSKAV